MDSFDRSKNAKRKRDEVLYDEVKNFASELELEFLAEKGNVMIIHAPEDWDEYQISLFCKITKEWGVECIFQIVPEKLFLERDSPLADPLSEEPVTFRFLLRKINI